MGNWAETHRVRARVTFAGGRSIEGDLHMQSCTALHRDVETPLEMLNRAEEFFAITLPSSGVALVAKSQTTLVTCMAIGSDIDSDRAPGGKSVRLDNVGDKRYELIRGYNTPRRSLFVALEYAAK